MNIGGRFDFELLDALGEPIDRWSSPNAVTMEGANSLLFNSFFVPGGQNIPWAIGLIDAEAFSSISKSDTYVNHPGWVEFAAAFRQPWPGRGAVVTLGSTTNPAPVSFSLASIFNVIGAFKVAGAFLVGNGGSGIRSASSGMVSYPNAVNATLYCATAFAKPRPLQQGGSINVNYTVTITP